MPFYLRTPGLVRFPLVTLASGWGEALEVRSEFPAAPGVYALVRPPEGPSALPKIVYVGMAKSGLAKRWTAHLSRRLALLVGTRSATGHLDEDHVLHATQLNEFRRRAMNVWFWTSDRPADDEALFVRAHARAHGHRPLHNGTKPTGDAQFVGLHLAGAAEWVRGRTAGMM